MTYEEILKRALEKVPEDLDKRQGSVMYLAIAPAAYELYKMYEELESVLNSYFANTATGENLTNKAIEAGIIRKPATYAIRKGIFNTNVPIESRFRIGETTYIVIEQIEDKTYKLQCEQLGEIGNENTGDMLPITFLSGLTKAQLTNILVAGTDKEDDESLRNRYFLKVQLPSTSGNANNYRQWALEVNGVGEAKVVPLWNGPGTVKVVIVDSDKKPASTELINKVSEYIESVRPIGASITVKAAAQKIINVSVTAVLNNSVFLDDVKNQFKKKVEEYIKSTAFKRNSISLAIIGSLLLDVEGVLDYENLKLNNNTSNISLLEEEIAVLGNVEVNV